MPESPTKTEMLEHYGRRQSRLYRWLRPPLPLIHDAAERSLPVCDGVKWWIGGAAGIVPAG